MSTTTLTNTADLLAALSGLTPLEKQTLEAAYLSSDGNGHDFGYSDDIEVHGKSKKAVGGAITSLIKKGLLTHPDPEFNQFALVTWKAEERQFAVDTIATFLNLNEAEEISITPAKPQEAAAPTTKRTTTMKIADITAPALSLFRRIIKELGEDPGKAVPSFEVFDKVKVDKPALEELAKKKLLGASTEKDGRKEFYSITLTKKGIEFKELVEGADLLGEEAPVLVVVSETLTAGKAKEGVRKSDGTAPAKPAAPAKPVAPAKPAPAPKAAPIDRAATRYEAIRHVMAAVKEDSWGKKDYTPMIKHVEATWPGLYKAKWDTAKRHEYSTGILDFCLAANRKMDKKPANA